MNGLVRIIEGIFLAGILACSNGTTTKENENDEPTQTVQTGNIQGKVVVPVVENNYWNWKGKDDISILIDGELRGKSVADGLFYISGIETGARELIAIYKKEYLSNEMGVPVYDRMLTTINKEIELIPTSEEGEIVYGIIYSDASRTSRYSGRLRIIGGTQSKTDISDGIYAFQGFVDGRDMMADIIPGKSSRRIRFFDKQNPADESWQIDLGDNWVAEQNGYVYEW